MSAPIPTQAGFLEWVRTAMGINAAALPDDSVFIGYAYNVSKEIVSPDFAVASPLIYMLMVYNLGGDNLMNWAPDNPSAAVPYNTYFTDTRKFMNLNSFVAGVIASSSDSGTSESLLTPDFLKGLTMSNLQNLKTPWGRQYLAFAQDGGTLWGLT